MRLIYYLEFYILVFLSKVTVFSLSSKVTLVVESHQLVVFKVFQQSNQLRMVFNVQPRNDEEIMNVFEQFGKDFIGTSPNDDDLPDDVDAMLLCEEDFTSLPHSEESVYLAEFIAFALLKAHRFQEVKTVMHRALEYLPNYAYFQFYLALGYYFTGETLVSLSIGRAIDFSKIIKEAARVPVQEMTCDCPGCGSELSSSMLVTDLSAETKVANKIQALFHDIHQLNQAKEYDQAIELYEELFAQVGEPPCLLIDLAMLYSKVKNYKKAKKTYARALKVNPGLYDAYRKLAATHRLLDEYELAVGVLKKAHKQFPEDDMILLELAAGYFKLGHTTKAVTSLEKALVIDPSMEHSLATMPDMEFLLNIIREKRATVSSS